MMMLDIEQRPNPVNLEPPPECNHHEWQLGCERCFFEAVHIAKGNIQTTEAESQEVGGVLMLWHLMIIIADMEQQLLPLTRGIDLRKNELAKDVIANLHQLSVYMMRLGGDPLKMKQALAQGAVLATQAKARMAAEAKAGAEPPPKPNLIITDAA